MAGVGTKSNGIAQPPKCAINGVHPRGSIRMGCLSQKIRGAHIALNAFDKNGPQQWISGSYKVSCESGISSGTSVGIFGKKILY